MECWPYRYLSTNKQDLGKVIWRFFLCVGVLFLEAPPNLNSSLRCVCGWVGGCGGLCLYNTLFRWRTLFGCGLCGGRKWKPLGLGDWSFVWQLKMTWFLSFSPLFFFPTKCPYPFLIITPILFFLVFILFYLFDIEYFT